MDIQAPESRIQTICLLVLTTFSVGAVLYWARPVLIPFILALMVALALTPLIDLMIRHLKFPRPLAILTTLIIAFLVLTLLGALVSVSVSRMISSASLYQQQIRVLVDNALEALPLEAFGVDPGAVLARFPLQAVGGVLVGTSNALLDILSNGFLVLIFVIFLLIGGRTRDKPLGGVWGKVEHRVKRYVVTKVMISACTGIGVGTVLAVLGVDLAMVFGVLAFLLNFIPSIGSVIATLLPLPVVLVDPQMTALTAVLALAIPGAIQITLGNFIEPKLLGETLELHPVVILMALLTWGILWGIVGMFLAAPLTAVMKILFERLEHMRPVARLMEGHLDALTED